MNRKFGWLLALGMLVSGSVGCMMPKITPEMMKQMVSERPQALEHLDNWIGTWEMTGEMTMRGEEKATPVKGVSVVTWEADKRVLVEKSSSEMGEWPKWSGVGLWGYDAAHERYNIVWFDNYGGSAHGHAKYCPDTKTWYFKAKSDHGKASGTAVLKDDNTIEWTHVERGPFGIKMFEFKGTSKRKG